MVVLCSSSLSIARHQPSDDCLKISLSLVSSWKISSYSYSHAVFPRLCIYLDTNDHTERIVLHLKSVVQHCQATRYQQAGIKILDGKYFGLFAVIVIMSEINHADCKSILACLIPDEHFLEAALELVESERDNKLVEAYFSITRDYNI